MPSKGSTSFLQTNSSGRFNELNFVIWSVLSKISTATLVEVMAVNASAGTVDIHPLVNQINGDGTSNPHGTIYGCPYFQLQSGASAIVIPPTVGDIGAAIFADRDISGVVSTKVQSNPGSQRMFDMSDGLYLGGMLNPTPTQIVEFSANGITITTPALTVNGPITVNGTVTSTGDVVANGISLENHVHGGVTPGSGNTGVPV